MRTIAFAGGGSGGHISPGIALAEGLDARGVASIFLCSDRAVDAHMLGATKWPWRPMPARPLSIHPLRSMAFLRAFIRTQRLARAELRGHDVSAVVTLGGFVAVPVARAASSLDIPVVMLNLDDPPGAANRAIARWATQRWTSCALGDRSAGFSARVVGLPIRSAAVVSQSPAECRRRLSLSPDRPTLLITGASQGSSSLNELMMEVCARDASHLEGWQVLHLTGGRDDQGLDEAYRRAGIPARVMAFLDAMGLAWGAATLCVSRAGANAVAEVALAAVPTLFLPYPWHKDQHQARNAAPLAACGGAIVLRDHVDRVANLRDTGLAMKALLRDRAAIDMMRASLLARRPENPVDSISREIEAVAEGALARSHG